MQERGSGPTLPGSRADVLNQKGKLAPSQVHLEKVWKLVSAHYVYGDLDVPHTQGGLVV